MVGGMVSVAMVDGRAMVGGRTMVGERHGRRAPWKEGAMEGGCHGREVVIEG